VRTDTSAFAEAATDKWPTSDGGQLIPAYGMAGQIGLRPKNLGARRGMGGTSVERAAGKEI
jgi:hypothetical protein